MSGVVCGGDGKPVLPRRTDHFCAVGTGETIAAQALVRGWTLADTTGIALYLTGAGCDRGGVAATVAPLTGCSISVAAFCALRGRELSYSSLVFRKNRYSHSLSSLSHLVS